MISYYFSSCNSDIYLPSIYTVNIYGRVHSVTAVGSANSIGYDINGGVPVSASNQITGIEPILLDSIQVNAGDTISFNTAFNAVNSQYCPIYVRVGTDMDISEITAGSGCDFFQFQVNQNTNYIVGVLNDGATFCDYS